MTQKVTAILCDIEGTTTDIHFVHKILFPYSKERLGSFLKEHWHLPNVQDAVTKTRTTANLPETAGPEDIENILKNWIIEDRKEPPLKQLQGLIWENGYHTGAFKGHVYDDVVPALQRWSNQGLTLAIYSSGSVYAQKLLFSHSTAGDLTHYFTHYFDTAVGGKKEKSSYGEIAKKMERPAHEILFLSDVPAELNAARSAGLQVAQLLRPGTEPAPEFPGYRTFDEIPV